MSSWRTPTAACIVRFTHVVDGTFNALQRNAECRIRILTNTRCALASRADNDDPIDRAVLVLGDDLPDPAEDVADLINASKPTGARRGGASNNPQNATSRVAAGMLVS